MNMSKKAIESLQKRQIKLLKAALGLKSYCRNTPILQAINITRISQFIRESQGDVMKSLIRNETKCLTFYCYILSLRQFDINIIAGGTMVQCKKDDVSMIRYLYDDTYFSQVKRQCKPVENDDLVDSVKQIIVNEFHSLNCKRFEIYFIVCFLSIIVPYIVSSHIWSFINKQNNAGGQVNEPLLQHVGVSCMTESVEIFENIFVLSDYRGYITLKCHFLLVK